MKKPRPPRSPRSGTTPFKIARGGSPFRRIARAAKWFVIGAAAGAITAKSAH